MSRVDEIKASIMREYPHIPSGTFTKFRDELCRRANLTEKEYYYLVDSDWLRNEIKYAQMKTGRRLFEFKN